MQTTAPHSAPDATLAVIGNKLNRLGVDGSLSVTNSLAAMLVRVSATFGRASNFNGCLRGCQHC